MGIPVIHTLLIVVAALSQTIGCRSVQSPSIAPAVNTQVVARASSLVATDETEAAVSRWPMRWGNDPEQRGTIIELEPDVPLRPIHLSRHHQFRSTDVEYTDANQLAADIGIETGFKFKSEAGGSFLFVPNPENKVHLYADPIQDSGTLQKSDIPDLSFKFVSATKYEPDKVSELVVENQKTGEKKKYNMTIAGKKDPEFASGEDHVELQRTWFTYRDPKGEEYKSEPVGMIILLPGMFGTPDVIIDGLEKYWHHQDYGVLRMRSHPSRFTQHAMMNVVSGNEKSVARKAAAINDERVAEGAYATKAALDYVMNLRPGLQDKPIVLVGMSGGAMMLPTVYAYSPEAYDGAVLIAGGADFLMIAIESNYKAWIDAMVFDFKAGNKEPRLDTDLGKPTDEQLETLSASYLKKSKLDAYHTATEMTDIPVLMLHASADKAVPSSSGQLLYQQLGQPERWSYPIGHELIFAGLPTQVTRIDKWITKHVIDPASD